MESNVFLINSPSQIVSKSQEIKLSPNGFKYFSVSREDELALQFQTEKKTQACVERLRESNHIISEKSKPFSIDEYLLPNEIMLAIFSKLSFVYYKNIALVSKKWNQLIIDKSLELKLYYQLVKKVISPDKKKKITPRRASSITMNIYAVNFTSEGFLDVKKMQERQRVLPNDKRRKGFHIVSPKFRNSQFKRIYKYSDFYVYDRYIIEGEKNREGFCQIIKSGVVAKINKHNLTTIQKKIINELPGNSCVLKEKRMKQMQISTQKETQDNLQDNLKKRKATNQVQTSLVKQKKEI